MKSVLTAAVCVALIHCASAGEGAGPTATAAVMPIAPPRDHPYTGEIRLAVDASDVGHRVIQVHETVSGLHGDVVLLYPKWLPGTHAPEGPIDRLANLRISAGGARIPWMRDPADVFAFRVRVPSAAPAIDIDFSYLSPTSARVGNLEVSRDIAMIEWNELILYPAGYFARRIPVQASLAVPAGWQLGTALETESNSAGRTTFKRVDLETLVDSPVYAGHYASRLDLDPGAPAAVHMDLFADRPEELAVRPEELQPYRALVQQAYKLFNAHHYRHYDFLYSLSDQLQQSGLEHHQSSEDGSDPALFIDWARTLYDRDLLPHEFTHSWNGKFRRPADLWTPNYNVPMQDSLLWMYEGQTQYWGNVLAARSGLRTRQQALDQLAVTAAYYQNEPGRRWRSLQDTTSDEIINPRRPQSWQDWQRFEDYYEEGELIWLDADTLIRERSQGRRSLDDFARAFFGIDPGSTTVVTYTFEDIVRALNAIEPYDWAKFLHERVDSVGKPAPLDGVARGGYRLVYGDAPSDYLKTTDEQRKRVDLLDSLGIEVDDKDEEGTIAQVRWDSPAFKANVAAGSRILAIDGAAYSADWLRQAVGAAKSGTAPIELILKSGDRFAVVNVDYHGGLRYPHLERDTSVAARLDDILAPR